MDGAASWAIFGVGSKAQCAEALAGWQWWNCAAQRVPPGLELLRINLDETAVCLFQGGGKGTVICRKRRLNGELVQRATVGRR